MPRGERSAAASIWAGASVSSVVASIVALAFALLCAALGLLLWQRAVRRQEHVSTERFVESRLAQPVTHPSRGGNAEPKSARPLGRAALPKTSGTPASEPRGSFRGVLDDMAARAGLDGARMPILAAFGLAGAITVWVAFDAGTLAAVAACVACVAALALAVNARAHRRKLSIVRQLPTFLDGIVRLITLGNSVPAAFQAALATTDEPLRECLERVARTMRAGVEIDRALAQVGSVYRLREFALVGAVLRLSVKYGGRADVMLERMSAFMRDLEQAERELAAMSAETRMSAWVLAVLPLLIGGFLIASNPEYFNAMWQDAGGRTLVYVAFGLQGAGGCLLYRLARLRS